MSVTVLLNRFNYQLLKPKIHIQLVQLPTRLSVDKASIIIIICFYLRLFAGWLVCEQDYTKTNFYQTWMEDGSLDIFVNNAWILMKNKSGVFRWLVYFYAYHNKNPDPAVLNMFS